MPFPTNVRVFCDPNPPTDEVTAYHFTQDGGPRVSAPGPQVTMTVQSPGEHTFAVVAENAWGESDPMTVTVRINPAGKPTGLKVEKG